MQMQWVNRFATCCLCPHPQAKSQQDKRMWILHLKRLILENHPAKIPAKVRARPHCSLCIHWAGSGWALPPANFLPPSVSSLPIPFHLLPPGYFYEATFTWVFLHLLLTSCKWKPLMVPLKSASMSSYRCQLWFVCSRWTMATSCGQMFD